jgi:dihydropteridine reductase
MKNILCFGGCGQLGSKVLSLFSPYNVVNIDLRAHENAKKNIIIEKGRPNAENNKLVIENVRSLGLKYRAIVVTAGGWIGGNIKDDDYIEKVKLMNEVNLYPSLLAAHLATKYLEPNGLVIFTGAAAVYK